MTQSRGRENAKSLLLHYFNLMAGEKPFQGDCISEIRQIVDEIVDAAVEESKRAIEERGGDQQCTSSKE